jgi:hypothetical protein
VHRNDDAESYLGGELARFAERLKIITSCIMSGNNLSAFLMAAACAVNFSPEASAQLTFRRIALTGEIATGSGQVDGRPDGAFLGSSVSGLPFVVPVISSTGQIAFEGSVGYSTPVAGRPDSRAGIWVWDPVTGTLRLVMISGSATPAGGTFGSSFSEVRVGHDGTVLFDALISGPGPTHLFQASPSSVLSAVVSQTAPAPGVAGGQFGDARQGRGFINNGHVFTNQPVSPNLGNGAWQLSGGALQPVIVPGMAVPGNAAATFASGTVAAVGGNGKAVLFGGVREGATTTAALWHGNSSGLTRVAMVGQAAPGRSEFEPLTYTGLTEASTNDAGQVAFTGHASSFLSAFIPALWTGTPGITPDDLRLVQRRDDFATNPHFPSDRFNSFSRPGINGSGQIAFQGNTDFNRDGFWVSQPVSGTESFTLSNIVIEGQSVSAPEFGSGVTFGQLNSGFAFNALGQMVFLANLAGSGITTANDLSLWGYDPQEGLQLVAQEGRPFLVGPGDERIVSGRQGALSYFEGVQFMSGGSGQDGRATGLSDNGTLTFLLNFSDNTSALFSASLRPVGSGFFWRGTEALDDNWHTVVGANTNWKDSADQIEQPPGSLGTEIVTIRNAPVGGVFITGADVNIRSLDSQGGLTVRRKLELSSPSTIGSVVLDHLESEVVAHGTEVILNEQGNRWTQGTLSGTDGGTFLLSTGARLELDSAGNDLSVRSLTADLTSRGTIVQNSGLFGLDATLSVEAGATIRLRTGSIVGSGAIHVAGRLEKTNAIGGGRGLAEIFVPVNSDAGLLIVDAGDLLLGAGGTLNGGRWEIHPDTVLEINAGFGVDTDINADLFIGGELGTDPAAPTGEVRLVSGDVYVNGAATATVALNGTNGLLIDGSIIGGTGTLLNKRTATWKSGRFEFDLGGRLVNEGSLLLSDSAFDYEFAGRLHNKGELLHRGKSLLIGDASILNEGTFTVLDNAILVDAASHTALFENQGRLEFFGEFGLITKVLDFRLQTTGPGELVVEGIALDILRSGTHQDAGFVTVRDADSIRFTAPQVISGASSFTGAGQIEIASDILISSGQLTSSIGAAGGLPSLKLVTGGNIEGPGAFINTGAVSWDGGRISGNVTHRGNAFTIIGLQGTVAPDLAGGTLTNEETVVQRGGLVVSDGGRIVNEPGAVFVLDDGDILHTPGSERGTLVLNNATLRGEGRVEARLALNGGQVIASGPGNLSFAGGGDSSGGGTLEATDFRARVRFVNGSTEPSSNFNFSGDYLVKGAGFELGAGAAVHVSDGEFVLDTDSRSIIEGDMRGGIGGRVTVRSSVDWNAGTFENVDFIPSFLRTNSVRTGAPKEIRGEVTVIGDVMQEAGAAITLAGNLRLLPDSLTAWTIRAPGGFTGTGRITNDASFSVENPQLITFPSGITFDNRHTFRVREGARAAFQSGVLVQFDESGGTGRLTGGNWYVENGGQLTLGSARLASSDAFIFLSGSGVITNLSGDFVNDGGFSLRESAQFFLNGTFTNSSTLAVEFGSALIASSIVNNGIATINGELTGSTGFFSSWKGSGKVNGQLINGGSGSPGNSPGTFFVNGDYTQLDTGSLLIELASPTSFDLLSITGSAILDGTLSISLDAGFVPAPADTFTFLTAADVSGEFSNAPGGSRLATADGLGSFLVSYDPDSVFLSEYAAIPEPSALSLVLIGVAAAAGRRHRAQR